MQVVDETQPFEGGTLAVSSFGFGGANFHMVLEGKGGQRIQIQQAEDSNLAASDDEEEIGGKSTNDSVIPLASRTAEGLVYLAKVINKVCFKRSAAAGLLREAGKLLQLMLRRASELQWGSNCSGVFCDRNSRGLGLTSGKEHPSCLVAMPG